MQRQDCLSTCSLMGAGCFYPFALTCMRRSLFRTRLPIDLKMYPDVEFLGYTIAIFIFLKGFIYCFPSSPSILHADQQVLCQALGTWGRKARLVCRVLETHSILVQGVRRGMESRRPLTQALAEHQRPIRCLPGGP